MATKNPKNQTLLEIFGSNVRKYRNAKGLSMQQLADQADLHKGGIYLIENAKVNTTISTAVAIAQVLGVSVNELIQGA